MSEPIVRTIDLSKTFRSGGVPVPAVVDVSLDIEAGEFVAIVGRSGSGKSTLLALMGLLARPDSGRYEMMGDDVSRLSETRRAATRCALVGFVFQASALLPRLTLLENVAIPLIYAGVGAGERRGRAIYALDRVGMAAFADRRPSQLSGGEQQRASIARAIVNDPALILADEPTGALDSKTAEGILDVFDDLNAEGRTLCVVTHADDVANRASRRIVLADGAVVAGSGAPLSGGAEGVRRCA